MPLSSDYCFVFVGLQSWDTDIGSNARNLALEISQTHRVLFVNSPLDRKTRWQSSHRPEVQARMAAIGKPAAPVAAGDNLWHYYPNCLLESINFIDWPWLFDFLNRINNRRLAKSIAEACQKLGFKRVIVFNDNEIFRAFNLKELLQPEAYVYYSRDYLLGVDYWKKHGTRLEPQLMAKATLVAANSHYLQELAAKYNHHSYYVGQGVELDLFDPLGTYKLPTDLRPITLNHKPIIGYVGALASLRLDIDLLVNLAKRKPNWNLVLVGPPDRAFETSALAKLPNVYMLGRKDPSHLAGYVRYFDVCLNPQLVNPVTIGNYPRKVDEYLAMGKPVVATRTPAMQIFAEEVYLASSADEYIHLIQQALDEEPGSRAAGRMALARQHTWANSVSLLFDAIEQTLANAHAAKPVA